MTHLNKKISSLMAALCLTSVLLTACGGVTEEMLVTRESAIVMMEEGNYEGAVAAFNGLVENAKKVTEFELDILKYRAEAEFLLKDYEAALHTYQTLKEVDKERPEYCYVSVMALANLGRISDAEAMLEAGVKLDKKHEAAGYYEAKLALADGYEACGNVDAAEGIYQELIALGFGNSSIYNRLMLITMNEGDYEGALTWAAKGMILEDDLAMQELKFNEAVCYEFLGEFKKALELFKAYEAAYGSDERVAHEIAFLETR
ncbi:MAG: hypothetical protein IKU20_00095 [Lachnospiraceae bacterium]|nr:hypothetical protein [Lachnospiraceae bacterium]